MDLFDDEEKLERFHERYVEVIRAVDLANKNHRGRPIPARLEFLREQGKSETLVRSAEFLMRGQLKVLFARLQFLVIDPPEDEPLSAHMQSTDLAQMLRERPNPQWA